MLWSDLNGEEESGCRHKLPTMLPPRPWAAIEVGGLGPSTHRTWWLLAVLSMKCAQRNETRLIKPLDEKPLNPVGKLERKTIDYWPTAEQYTQSCLLRSLPLCFRSKLTLSFYGQTTWAVQKPNCQQQSGVQNSPRFRYTSKAGDDIWELGLATHHKLFLSPPYGCSTSGFHS